jgi:hypothetical protein
VLYSVKCKNGYELWNRRKLKETDWASNLKMTKHWGLKYVRQVLGVEKRGNVNKF